jgi:hypothetical protein
MRTATAAADREDEMKRTVACIAVVVAALALGAAGARAGKAGCAGIPVTVAQAFACQPPPRHARPVVRPAAGGFDWGSAAIGAAAAAAVLLAVGSTAALLRREHPTARAEV